MGQVPNQLKLDLPAPHLYRPGLFLEHQGVTEIVGQAKLALASGKARLLWIEGAKRSGKTHLVSVIDEISRGLGLRLCLLAGAQLAGLLGELTEEDLLGYAGVVIDDIDIYLQSVGPGHSGQLVNLLELCRNSSRVVFALSSTALSELPCDNHVISRLRGATIALLGPPADSELPLVIDIMAKQRGVRPMPRARKSFLIRGGRSIADIQNMLDTKTAPESRKLDSAP